MPRPLDIFESLSVKQDTRIVNQKLSYNSLTHVMIVLWNALLAGMGKKWAEYESLDDVFKWLIEPALNYFFSPRITKKAKTKILENYPSSSNMEMKTYQDEIQFLEEYHLVEIVKNVGSEQPIITPEAMILCHFMKSRIISPK